MRIKYTKTLNGQVHYSLHYDDSSGRTVPITQDELNELIEAVTDRTGTNLCTDEIILDIRINS